MDFQKEILILCLIVQQRAQTGHSILRSHLSACGEHMPVIAEDLHCNGDPTSCKYWTWDLEIQRIGELSL